jgi:PAS domain S-box-containing protein
VDANAEYVRLTGREAPADVLGHRVTEWTAPHDLERNAAEVAKCLATGSVRNLVIDYVQASGATLPVEINATVLPGPPPRIFSICRDIIERTRAEQTLRESEGRLRALSDASFEAIFISEKGICLEQNLTAEKMFGYTAQEAIGRPGTDWIAPGDRDLVMRNMLAGVEPPYRVTALRKDGTTFPCEIQGRMSDYQGRRVRVTALRDITERRLDELRLDEQQHFIDAALDAQNDTFFLFDPATGRALRWNRAFRDISGYTDEEIAALPAPTSYYGPDDLRRAAAAHERLSRGESAKLVMDLICKDGRRVTTEYHASSVRNAAGEFQFVIAVGRDITERKRAEEALHLSEERYRLLYEGTPVMMHSINPEGRLISVSDHWLRTLGYTREEVLGRRSTEFLDEPSRHYAREVVLPEFMRTGVCSDIPYTFLKKSGEPVATLLSAIAERDEAGNVLRSLAVIVDVTERRRAEEALRESEERYRELFEAESDAIFLIDNTSGAILAANDAAAALYGYGREELLRMKNIDLSAEPSETQRVTEETPIVKDNAVRIPLRHHRKKDGTVFPVEITGRFFSSRGRAVHIAAIRDVTERLQAGEALRKSEQMLRAIIDSGPDCIKLIDREARLILMNPAGLAMIEANSLDQVRGENVCLLVAPGHRDAFMALTGKVFAGGSGTLQFQMIGLKGRRLWLESFAVPLRDSAGEITALLGVTRDITDRKRAEDEVRRNEARMASLYRISQQTVEVEKVFLDSALQEAIAITGSAIGYLYLYDEAKREFTLNSYSKDVMKECAIADVKICYELDRTGIWGEAVRQRGPILLNDFAADHPLKKGYPEGHAKLRRFLTVPIVMEGAVVAVVGVANKQEEYTDSDVTQLNLLMDSVWKMVQRARAERALQESEEHFRDLAESLPLAIFETDLQGRFTYANRVAFETFGYSRQELKLGVTMEQVIVPEDRERARQTITRRLRGDVVGYVEYHALRKDGSTYPITVLSSPILREGKPTGLRGIAADLTERKALEEERLKAQKLASLGTLAGGIAHDFNNLLQGVFGYTSLIRLTLEQREKALEMLDRTERALHEAVNLTNQLLTFSKGGTPVKKVIALPPVVENAAMLALSGSRVRHLLTADADLRPVEADAGQVGQVVRNIVLNAEQAMPLGGTVEITLRNARLGDVPGRGGPEERSGVEIRIRDHGTGIPPEHLSRIFDPYFTTKEKGSGLGLATAYSIVRNHDGVITAESVMGAGTTFTIRLPATDAPPEVTHGSRETAGRRTGHILVMDDEAVVRDVARELLRQLGHAVESAAHGEEALARYRAAREAGRPFDAVILDLTIRGGMGGIETLRELRKLDPRVRAIISSGYSEEASAADSQQQGFRAFLAKPYTVKSLVEVLERVLAPEREGSPPG